MVAVGLSLEAKREVLEQFIPVYRDAVGTQKRVVLDDVVRLTCYHRTYASWLLNQPTPEHQPPVCPRQRHYGAEVEEVRADPTLSCRAMFEELRRLTPDRYQPSPLRTLQRGVCKIRARLSHVSVQSQKDVSDETVSIILVSEEHEPHDEANEQAGTAMRDSCARVSAHAPSFSSSFDGQGELAFVQEPSFERVPLEPSEAKQEQVSEISLVLDSSAPIRAVKNPLSITIEEAIEEYLEAQQRAKRRPKTMEWHQTALGLFGQYLRTECGVFCLLR